MRPWLSLVFATALCGCRFQIGAAPLVDAAPVVEEDLGFAPDLGGGDLAPVPDLALPLKPSHVDPTSFPRGTGALSGVTQIDTTRLSLQLASATLPDGVYFQLDATKSRAVLSVGTWVIDRELTVVGGLPLVVVASSTVEVAQMVHLEARFDLPGPGGGAAREGLGAGRNGNNGGLDDSGGGGGAFGGVGGAGGQSGGAPGSVYGPLLSDFNGGSGGGDGASADSCPDKQRSRGGAGGGAMQISAGASITVLSSGAINAGGGGGRGGCLDVASAGGGGGSGGTIFLEAPVITVDGKLAAHGGGGGSGAQRFINHGQNGENGALTAAKGGASPGIGAGAGGDGATSATPAKAGEGATNAGGGGGGLGRIWLRTRGAPPSVGGSISPAPATDATL